MSNILKLFIKKGFLLDKSMLDFFNELEDENVANEILDKIMVFSKEKLITKKLIDSNLEKIRPVLVELNEEKKKLIEKYFVNISVSVEVIKEREIIDDKNINKKEVENTVRILSSPVMAFKKLEVKDFIKHFRNRYTFLQAVLQRSNELENLISIDKIRGSRDSFSIIGIVSSKMISKNKNMILEIEDLTGKIKVLIKHDKEELYEKAKNILLDDVLGFKCSGTKDFLFVNNIIFPEAKLGEKRKLDEESYAVFISDIHIGSRNFLENSFKRFIEWLNGDFLDSEEKTKLEKIKYIFIAGDNVDGVGVYPGQSNFLNILDIKEQYERLAEYLEKIPKHIKIIMCPGQHDGVRVAEPQPALGMDFAEPLHKIKNLYLVSNPAFVEIGGNENKKGIKVLMYHGASFSSIINEIEDLRLNKAHSTPSKVVKQVLKRRHLAPSHSDAVYIPNEKEDDMLIREIPDIVATADLHKSETDFYNNIQIICSSCWQSTTPFEEKVGNFPDPCKVPILNLKTREVKILDFSEEK